MQEFKAIKQVCTFLVKKECKYWSEPTECHFFNCPHYSIKTTPKEKRALKKKFDDSVYFNVNVFDSITKKSTIELIQEARERHPIHSPSRISTLVASRIQRMHCISCGEIISDDNYLTIQDPKGVLLYFHSSCKSRLHGVPSAREGWLTSRTKHKVGRGKPQSYKQLEKLINLLDGQKAKIKQIIKAPSVPSMKIIKQKKEPAKAPSIPMVKQKKKRVTPSVSDCFLCNSPLSSNTSYSYQSPSGVLIKFCKNCNPKSIVIVTDINLDPRFTSPSRQIVIRNQDQGAYLRTQK